MEHLSLQLQGHASSPALSSPFLPQQQEVSATPTISSKDQTCVSSESGESHGKHISAQVNPMVFVSNSDLTLNKPPSHAEINQSVIQPPYNYPDPYYSGLYAAYGPQPYPQMFGFTSTRVPLELAEDGPIFVNAKQYHGILRRRQVRARLESQNKLLKNRRPYLHESRHLHAVKRERGNGGRFLSTKKLENSVSAPLPHIAPATAGPHSIGLHPNAVVFQQQQPDHMLSTNSSAQQFCSPIVR